MAKTSEFDKDGVKIEYIPPFITDFNKLADNQWRLECIIQGTNAGTREWNVQTGETIFNDRWAQIIGYNLDELKPISIKTWELFTHPEDLKKSGEILKLHFLGELPYALNV